MMTKRYRARTAARMLLLMLSTGVHAAPPRFAVFAPNQEAVSVLELVELLSVEGQGTAVEATTLQDALDADAEVLVLFLHMCFPAWLAELVGDAETIAALRETKIIGIGDAAARLFQELGLGLHMGARAQTRPQIVIQQNGLMRGSKKGVIVAFEVGQTTNEDTTRPSARANENIGIVFTSTRPHMSYGMCIPAGHEATEFVEVIARCPGDEKYAPIVRQGHHVMVGLAAPASLWTSEYRAVFRSLALSLASAGKSPFQGPQWQCCPPGHYRFELAEGRSKTELASRRFHFKFEAATKFSARLEHEGSAHIMLSFIADNGDWTTGTNGDWTREDANGGEDLTISTFITEQDVESVGTGYWALTVNNCDRKNRARCHLRIDYKGANQ